MKASSTRPSSQRDSPLVPLEGPPRLIRLGSSGLFVPVDPRRSFSPLCFNTPSSSMDDWLAPADTTANLAKAAVLAASVSEGRFTPSSLAQRVSSPMRAKGSKSLADENENHGNTFRSLQEKDDEKENKRMSRARLPHKKKAKSGLGANRSKLAPTETEATDSLAFEDFNTKVSASSVVEPMEEVEQELASFPPTTPLTGLDTHRKSTPRPFLFTPLREAVISPIASPLAQPQAAHAPRPRVASRASAVGVHEDDVRPPPMPQQHGCIFVDPVNQHPTRLAAPCLAAAPPAAAFHFGGGEPVPFQPPQPYAPFFAAAAFGQADVPACAAMEAPAGFPTVLRPEPVRAEQEQQQMPVQQEEEQGHRQEEERVAAAGEVEQQREEEQRGFRADTIAPGSAAFVHGAAML